MEISLKINKSSVTTHQHYVLVVGLPSFQSQVNQVPFDPLRPQLPHYLPLNPIQASRQAFFCVYLNRSEKSTPNTSQMHLPIHFNLSFGKITHLNVIDRTHTALDNKEGFLEYIKAM